MPRAKFNPRERRLLVFAGVAVGMWFVFARFFEPLWERAQELSQQVASQSAKVDKLNELFAKRQAIDQEYQLIQPYVSEEAPDADPATFLGELEALARRADVQVDLRPKPAVRRGDVTRVGLEIDLNAPQDHVLAFLDAVFNMPRLIEIKRVHISSAPGRSGLLRAHLVMEQLVLHR